MLKVLPSCWARATAHSNLQPGLKGEHQCFVGAAARLDSRQGPLHVFIKDTAKRAMRRRP